MTAHPEFRTGRAILVIAVNGFLAFWLLRFTGPLQRAVLLSVPLLAGALFELVAPRAARFVNVGYFALVAVATAIAVVLAWRGVAGFGEPEHAVVALLLAGLPSAIFAVFLNWLYRVTGEQGSVHGEAA